jgi:hypothetical protein
MTDYETIKDFIDDNNSCFFCGKKLIPSSSGISFSTIDGKNYFTFPLISLINDTFSYNLSLENKKILFSLNIKKMTLSFESSFNIEDNLILTYWNTLNNNILLSCENCQYRFSLSSNHITFNSFSDLTNKIELYSECFEFDDFAATYRPSIDDNYWISKLNDHNVIKIPHIQITPETKDYALSRIKSLFLFI